MASSYKALHIWLKHFPEYLAYIISRRPDFLRDFSYISFLSLPRFWAFCIEWLENRKLVHGRCSNDIAGYAPIKHKGFPYRQRSTVQRNLSFIKK